ncbi:hypothetical protein Sste5346_000565 [Sporothrix stenoceras]|uniref:Zn(2)-C6 fungal-type domain-containing protein n=1 Tax=Sporothrix stenoceras TaxID=5173 RepID=A0ABR3ZRG4_9PEZI
MSNKKISNYTSVFRVRLGDDKVASIGNSSTSNAAGNNGTTDSQQQRSADSNNTAGPPIRRSQPRAKSRPVVSCLLCRTRKQKCDRLLPCGTCTRRGDGALCRYGNEGGVSGVNAGSSAAPSSSLSGRGVAATGAGSSSGSGSGHGRRPASSASAGACAGTGGPTGSSIGARQEAQLRLQRLEEMVNGLVSRAPASGSQDGAAASKDGETAAKTPTLAFGDPDPAVTGGWQATEQGDKREPRFEWNMPIGPGAPPPSVGPVASMLGQTPFSGATNWAAVLDSIRDIQSYLGEAAKEDKSRKQGAAENEDGGEQDDDADENMGDNVEEVSEQVAASGQSATNQAQNQQQKKLHNPFLKFVSKPTMYGGVTDPKTVLLPASLSGLPSIPKRPAAAEPAEKVPPLAKSISVAEAQASLPSYTPFQLAEPDGIFSAVAAAPGLASSDQSNPPATSHIALNPPLPKHLADAIACLPPRSDCDRLMAVYFQTSYMTGPFVHTGYFQRSYLRFWRTGNPAAANPISPLLWMSMLASILSMGAMIDGGRQLAWMADREQGASHMDEHGDNAGADGGGAAAGQKKNNDADPELSNEDLILATRLQTLSTRCLLAGDYLAGRQLAVEALVLNAHVRLMQKRDADATQWATFGVIVRLAQRMGYHQVDAPGGSVCGIGGRRLTPFEREMRRRVWYFVESFDMLFSFQFGMPTVVHEDEVATDPPSNLIDDDFDETTAELPPSRPPTDYTTSLYFTVKLKLIRLLRRVMRVAVWRNDKAQIHGAQSYKATVTRITEELRWNFTTLPVRLRMPQHIRDCPFNDASHDIMHRLAAELMHHKAVCILFRDSLSRDIDPDGGVDSKGFTASETKMQRQACLVSALRILDLHTEFEYETRPESMAATVARTGGPLFQASPEPSGGNRGVGRLATDRNMISSLALHDFLLAATILCLDLIEGNRQDQGKKDDPNKNQASESGSSASNEATTAPASSTKNLELPPSLVFAPFLGGGGSSLEERAADRGAKMIALRTAYALWHERRLTSRDAAHAARILGAIVTKLSSEVSDGVPGDKEYDATGNKVRPWPESDSPGWGHWDIAAREQRRKQYEDDLKKQRAERAERAERNKAATTDHNGSQSDTSRSRDASSTPNNSNTPASQTTDSASTGAQSQGQPQAQNPALPPQYQQQQQPQAPPAQHASPSQPPPPPPHLNYAYEWAEPGPFDAVLNDPMNVDWNMVDWFLLDRQLDVEVGSNVWSADLMALEN